MSKDNSRFFEKKQIWSEVKDQLLSCYLKPYIQKILTTQHPIFYVDCFAGKGKFDDGADGSPLIALKIIDDCLNSTSMARANINSCFIDLNYADDLNHNLANYRNIKIIPGKYEENIQDILHAKRGQNVFLYIDPYGIKALNCELFDKFSKFGFNSIELLINMNSFGFMREACRVKKVVYSGIESFDDIVEYDPTTFDSSIESIKVLTEIAGGDYWEEIVDDYRAGVIDGYEAEKRFSVQYCQRLGQNYRYVLNMPIRLHKGQRPKYRMIHATNHEDGCVLMYENICKRWEVLEEMQTGGQIDLFNTTIDDDFIDLETIQETLRKHLLRYDKASALNVILADFAAENGVLCKKIDIIKMLQFFEEKGIIEVSRKPQKTLGGNDAKFFSESSKKHVWIRGKL